MLATVIRKKRARAQRDRDKDVCGCRDGRTFGTIGGGRAEAEVRTARRSGSCRVRRAVIVSSFTESQRAGNMDAACGGDLDVLLEPVMERHLDLYRKDRGVHEETGRGGSIVTKFREGLLTKNPGGKRLAHLSVIHSDLKEISDCLRIFFIRKSPWSWKTC